MVYVDYNPDRGVTFRENRNSDVQIVGIGYNEDITTLDSKSLNGINKKAIDKRRHTKGKKACFILYSLRGSMLLSFHYYLFTDIV